MNLVTRGVLLGRARHRAGVLVGMLMGLGTSSGYRGHNPGVSTNVPLILMMRPDHMGRLVMDL